MHHNYYHSLCSRALNSRKHIYQLKLKWAVWNLTCSVISCFVVTQEAKFLIYCVEYYYDNFKLMRLLNILSLAIMRLFGNLTNFLALLQLM